MSASEALRSRLRSTGKTPLRRLSGAAATAGAPAISERTTAILAHRRGVPVARRRGWLVRRALFLADLVGIAVGTTAAALLAHGSFWYALIAPLILLLAKLYGLYDGDEEHAHHSTVGDLIGVFHVVTISAFLMIVGDGCRPLRASSSGPSSCSGRSPASSVTCEPRDRARRRQPQHRLPAERGHRRRRRHRPADRPEDPAAPRVRHQPRRLRRRQPEGAARGPRRPDDARHPGRPAAARLAARRRSRDRRLLGRVERGHARSSSASSATLASRSTSCPACSRPSARTPASTRSKGCR